MPRARLHRLARTRRPGRAGGGFSLLEVLLVTALVAAVGAVVVAITGNGLARMQLRSAVQDVAGNLRHARALAIATGRPQRFVIHPDSRQWRAGERRHGQLPRRVQVRFHGAAQVQPSAEEGAIVFFPDGASTGGEVGLQVGDAQWRVEVGWLTGQVRTWPP